MLADEPEQVLRVHEPHAGLAVGARLEHEAPHGRGETVGRRREDQGVEVAARQAADGAIQSGRRQAQEFRRAEGDGKLDFLRAAVRANDSCVSLRAKSPTNLRVKITRL